MRLPDYDKWTAKVWNRAALAERDLMFTRLVEQLWAEEDSISDEVKLILRDGLAAAHFAADPVTQARRVQAIERLAVRRK